MDSDLELFYFDIKGKGEPIRLLCKHAGLALKDNRLSQEQFKALQASGVLPFNQMPALLTKGRYIVQSGSILRYIGKMSGHYPGDPLEAALVDAVLDQIHDMFAGVSASKYRERFGFECLDEAAVASVRKSLNDVVLPKHLGYFEKLAKESSSGWIAGTEGPSIADFSLMPALEGLVSGQTEGISREILDPFPAICALISNFHALPIH